ncbi:MAG: hypothetical protein ACWGMY_01020 [Hyphomicrobiaceae bacterium]
MTRLSRVPAEKITQYLTANGGPERGWTKADLLRISEQPWFLSKHEKKSRISPKTLKRRGA